MIERRYKAWNGDLINTSKGIAFVGMIFKNKSFCVEVEIPNLGIKELVMHPGMEDLAVSEREELIKWLMEK